ncbi:MAG TPA: hypothetical protein VGI21_06305 [Streptosporangiaceae bacterium]
MTATQLRLRRYWSLPAHLWHLRTLRRQLRAADGLLGFTFAARLRDLTFWTIAAWADPDAAAIFGKDCDAFSQAFAPQAVASADVSWSCLVEELPIAWPEARHRLGAHPASGVSAGHR